MLRQYNCKNIKCILNNKYICKEDICPRETMCFQKQNLTYVIWIEDVHKI